MAWTIEFEPAAKEELAKLDKVVALRILRFLSQRVALMENPRDIGEALKGSALGEFWKYRVGGYRLICRILDARITIIVIRIGNRRDVYR
ncbi:MAG TPA: type II toxin-antitoxin system RelE/ParE family toxin [Roseiarcus sp.]|nr:type II toxin-antitoxin system RelE/ParE family toxin [Roseiarcus sp.]